jgi:hypothetical protein
VLAHNSVGRWTGIHVGITARCFGEQPTRGFCSPGRKELDGCLQYQPTKELYIRAGIFRRCERVRVRGKHAKQVPGKLLKLAFLVYVMRLMRQERFVNQRPERRPGLGDRFVNVTRPDGNGVLFGVGLIVHVAAGE